MSINSIPISTARKVGQTANAKRIAILAVDDDGNYCITTWGRTKADCLAAARFANNIIAEIAVSDLARHE